MRGPPLHVADYLGPAIAAVAFIAAMSIVREPARLRFNAILVAGAGGVYLGGGLGIWELPFAAAIVILAYLGTSSFVFIGVAWLLHSAWDIVHHAYGNPIWPFAPTSSFGCMIFDAIIGVWFLAGARPLVGR
jgi:hypothetical protein